MKTSLIFLMLWMGAFAGCTDSNVPAGQVLIRNDILDKDYNTVLVDQVGTKTGGVSFRKTLKPGERALIPSKGITRMRFSRRYKDHTKVYQVQCPGNLSEGIVIKLIDVHTGRMSGGCKLTKKGRSVQGVTEWEEEK